MGRAASPRPSSAASRPAPEAEKARSAYEEAVGVYERGVRALQRREFAVAAQHFHEVLERFPDERELHERVRLYLKVCEREITRVEQTPPTLEERVYAATLALNAGRHTEALDHLRIVTAETPDHDHAHYMLAIVHALRGERPMALTHLQRAIELNPENRVLALQDPDLDALRAENGFRLVMEAAASGPAGRRRPRARPPR